METCDTVYDYRVVTLVDCKASHDDRKTIVVCDADTHKATVIRESWYVCLKCTKGLEIPDTGIPAVCTCGGTEFEIFKNKYLAAAYVMKLSDVHGSIEIDNKITYLTDIEEWKCKCGASGTGFVSLKDHHSTKCEKDKHLKDEWNKIEQREIIRHIHRGEENKVNKVVVLLLGKDPSTCVHKITVPFVMCQGIVDGDTNEQISPGGMMVESGAILELCLICGSQRLGNTWILPTFGEHDNSVHKK